MLVSERTTLPDTQDERAAEALLVREAQAGVRAAFDRLVERHAAALVRTAYMILGNQHDAEDVAQEALISAYRNLQGYRPEAPFGAWLHRIVVNRSYDYVRRRQRQWKLVDEMTAESQGVEADQAVDNVRAAEQQAEVRELLATLDERNRAIVTLRFLQDMQIKDIASALEMPEGTVKRRLHDVLKLLRVRMEGAAG